MPWTYANRLRTLQNKTVRWPGHYAQWKAFRDAGLLSLDPVEVGGMRVIPRQLLCSLIGPQIEAQPGDPDLVIIRIVVRGSKQGRETEATIDLFDHADPATGFSAMERTTGWHAAIMAGLVARGKVPRGAVPVELAVPGDVFVAELRQRGFSLQVREAA
jgi:lysine 6-dehydrogenase